MTVTNTSEAKPLNRKDFVSDQIVRWCPGCGDYSILAQMQKAMPELGIPREKIVFVSGIGCSSRFPYYMNTYGLHTIHGRAPTIASGLKIANPDLCIWVITGDGDGLSIGANHLLHTLRRNIDLNIVLFNNRIYGLTKGQYSPTSLPGTKTKSSPMGSIEQSFNPISVALAAEATFVARSIDTNAAHLGEIFKKAAEHKGTSFIEVFQNCPVFNDKAWESVKDAKIKDDFILQLEHGKPMIFGKNRDKGIILDGLTPKVVELNDEMTEDKLLVHDESKSDATLAYLLGRMQNPEFPFPIGTFRCVEKDTYEKMVIKQVEEAQKKKGTGSLKELFHAADTWEILPGKEDGTSHGKVTSAFSIGNLDEEYLDTIAQDTPSEEEEQKQKQGLNVLPVSALQPRPPLTVPKNMSLKDTVERMQSYDAGCLLVTDEAGKLVGIFTENDILHRVAGKVEDLAAVNVSEYMTTNPTTLKSGAPVAQALNLMGLNNFRHLPIVDESNRPNGIISFRSVAAYITKNF